MKITIEVDVAGSQVRTYRGDIRWSGVNALILEALDQLRWTQKEPSGNTATVTVNDWDSREVVTASLTKEDA
jgi:hypothetical protein